MAFVDKVLDLEAAQSDSLARFANMSHGLGRRPLALRRGRCLFGHCFEGAFDDFFGRAAEAAGKPGLYHETITWAYVLLVHERRAATGAEDWPAFAARNPDLLAWKPSVLEARYYREETLWSDRARETFVLPDRPLTA